MPVASRTKEMCKGCPSRAEGCAFGMPIASRPRKYEKMPVASDVYLGDAPRERYEVVKRGTMRWSVSFVKHEV